MKRTQLQFPDNTSHIIDVVGLTYNPSLNMYVMQYHDITLHGNQNHMMYTYLEKVNNEFIRNPRLRQNIEYADAIGNIQIIDENILPDYIRCQSRERTNQPVQNNNQQKVRRIKFPVYKDQLNNNVVYIPAKLANDLKIRHGSSKVINNINCVQVTIGDIRYIQERTKNSITQLIANTIAVNLQKNATFVVYKDPQNRSYITADLANSYGITGRPTATINGNLCVLVNQADITYIHEKSKGSKTVLYPEYANILMQSQARFPVYRDPQLNNTLYIDEKLANSYGIPIRGKRIINGANCVAVTYADITYIHNKSKGQQTVLYANDVVINNNLQTNNINNNVPRKQTNFTVYRVPETNELYIDAKLANAYGITNKRYRMINNVAFLLVDQAAITYIQEKSKNSPNALVASYTDMPKLTTQEKFTVYRDTATNRLFMSKTLAYRFNIAGKDGKNKTIGNDECIEVTAADLIFIQQMSKNTPTALVPNYISIRSKTKPQQVKEEVQKELKVYVDMDSMKLYISKTDAIKFGLNPRNVENIDGKELVNVTQEELNTTKAKLKATNMFHFYYDEQGGAYVEKNTLSTFKLYGINEGHNIRIQGDDRKVYFYVTKKELEDFIVKSGFQAIGNPMPQRKNANQKPIIIYHDKENNKYFIKDEDLTDNSLKTTPKDIVGHKCYEISPEDLNKLNRKVTKVSVYGTENKKKEKNTTTIIEVGIVILDNGAYIPEDFAKENSINIEGKKKIRIDGNIFVSATLKELAIVKYKNPDKKIVLKEKKIRKIAPKKTEEKPVKKETEPIKDTKKDELKEMIEGNASKEIVLEPTNEEEENFSRTYAEWDMKSSRRFASNAATKEFDDLSDILERMLHKHKDDKHFVLLAVSYNVSFIVDVDKKWRTDIDVVRVAYKKNPELAKEYMDSEIVAQVEKEFMTEDNKTEDTGKVNGIKP